MPRVHRLLSARRVPAILAVALGLLCGPALTRAQTTGPSTAAPGTSPSDLRAVDRAFLTDATAASRLATELSRLAVSQATTSSVRDFAQQVVGDSAQINNALEALARRKALPLPIQPASFSEPYRGLAAESGAGFDRAYIRTAAALSRHALQLCETAVADGRDADVRELAGSLLPIIRDHVNKATQLEKTL